MKLTENLYYYPEYGMLDCNTYLIKDETTIIVDPGNETMVDQLVEDLEKDGINTEDIDIIANTHLHLDHCLANESFKAISGAKIGLHNAQKRYKDVALKEVSRFFGVGSPELTEDKELNSQINTGELKITLYYTPGHSPDSICFFCEKLGFLICGDLIFKRSTGRVDLPGGDKTKIKESIERLKDLSYEFLLPGHMEIIRGKSQIEENFKYIKRFVLDIL